MYKTKEELQEIINQIQHILFLRNYDCNDCYHKEMGSCNSKCIESYFLNIESLLPDNMYYKDYVGSIEYSEEDNCFYGKILNTNDLILYEGKTKLELEKSFHIMVDQL